ncbi:MAG: BON domain-containing protein, partial [Pseudomonadota bacterium]
MTTPRFAFAMIGLAAIGLGSTACTPVGAAIGAGASVGIAAAQERTVGAAVDDAIIQTRISERWFRHNEAMFQALDLTVVEGRVLITGTLQDPDKRVDAVRLAWQVDGVNEVINEVQLSENEGIRGFARDVRIAGELRSILTFDRQVSAVNYSVDTVGGVIYLMGIAQNQGELDRVIGHARNIDSVRRVVSYVRLIDEIPPGGVAVDSTVTTEVSPASPRDGVAVEALQPQLQPELAPQLAPQTSSIQ